MQKFINFHKNFKRFWMLLIEESYGNNDDCDFVVRVPAGCRQTG